MRRYPHPYEMSRVTLSQIAGEIDRSPILTLKLLAKAGFIGLKPDRTRRHVTYDAQALEVLKSMLDIPHRVISDDADDWLSRFADQGERNV